MLSEGVWPAQIGGLQKYCFNMLLNWTPMCERFTLVSSFQKGQPIAEVEAQLPEEIREKATLRWVEFKQTGILPNGYVRAYRKLSKEMFELVKHDLDNYDFVYAHGFCGLEFLNKNLKPKLITNLHGLEMFQYTASLKHKLQMSLFTTDAKKLIKNADYVISLGGELTNILKQQGADESSVLLQSVGVDEDWPSAELIANNDEALEFVFVGRYERRKGVEELKKACSIIASQGLKFNLNYVGALNEEHRKGFMNLTYHGEISNQDALKGVLDGSDVLICPSYSEGMPTVILEGMSRGLSIIATNVGATAELVDPEVGLLIKPGNVQEIVSAMKSYIKSTNKGIKNEHSITKVKERFLWKSIISNLNEKLVEHIKE